MTAYYLAFDVDHIQDTLFQCNWMRLVRAASLRLADITSEESIRKALPGIVGADAKATDIVFADGGGGLLKVPGDASSPDGAAAALEEWFRTATGFASLTAATIPCDWRPRGTVAAGKTGAVPRFAAPPATAFGQIFQALNYRLDRRKAARRAHFFEAVPSTSELCVACGRRGQVATITTARSRNVCAPCKARFSDSRDRFETLEDIADGKGLIALLYLDGNDVGRLRVEKATDEGSLTRFAKTLRDMCQRGLNAAKDQTERWIPVSLGGDDVAILVPGRAAFTALDAFRKGVSQGPTVDGITFSAGIVVAPHHTPIPLLHGYAAEMCKSAKELRRRIRDREADEWTCDVAISTGSSPMASDVRSLRKRALTNNAGGEILRLYGGPYRLSEVARLSRATSDFRAFSVSSSALRQLVEACRVMPRAESTLFAKAQWARDKGLRFWAAHYYPKWQTFPWRPSEHAGGEYVTDLADLLRWQSCLDTDQLATMGA